MDKGIFTDDNIHAWMANLANLVELVSTHLQDLVESDMNADQMRASIQDLRKHLAVVQEIATIIGKEDG